MDSAYRQKLSGNKKILSRKSISGSFLYSRGLKRENFFTGNSYLYFDCEDSVARKIIEFRTSNKLIDGLNKRAINDYRKFKRGKNDFLWLKYKKLVLKLDFCQKQLKEKRSYFLDNISVVRLWNTSILAAVIIGMISMSFIYRYLGQGAAAEDEVKERVAMEIVEKREPQIAKASDGDDYIAELADYLKEDDNKKFNEKVQELVEGYPIEDFLPYLQGKDREVVSFYIAIAKKESNWGKRVPVLKGEDCYNYVGFRGKSDRMGTGGHTCFADRKEAVEVVSQRIEELIKKYGRDTAKEMVVWKCGSDCNATGGQAAANKWIADVDMILKELKKIKK
ncbi:MAG: hypothetical protein V3574_00565 [Candidatus Moraniibacteriota bacterium]